MRTPTSIRLCTAALAALAAAIAIAACGSDDGADSASVAATTGITADLARHVAGPDLEVEQIVPDGASPHDYELSAQDRQRLEGAEMVVANGAGLEAAIPLDEVDAPIWELSGHVGELRRADGGADPHVWMDPSRAARALPSLADAMAETDPMHADAYRRRASEHASRLRALDRDLAAELDRVPADERVLVTSHDSLGYLADRYGYEVAATAFPATGIEAEASASRLDELERAVETTGVPTVYAQEGDDPEALRTVADATGVEVEYGLLVESPGAAGSYERMLRRDARLITGGLGAR